MHVVIGPRKTNSQILNVHCTKELILWLKVRQGLREREGHRRVPLKMAQFGRGRAFLRNEPLKTFDIKAEERGLGWREATEDLLTPIFMAIDSSWAGEQERRHVW